MGVHIIVLTPWAANTSTAYAIQQWVTSTYTAKTVGGSTVYDLTAAS